MARPKPWLKMWSEWVHDPKMLGLTLAEQGAWWRVVTLAQDCNAGGPLVKGSGAALTIEEIADTLHLEAPRDFKVLETMIKKMEDEDSLVWDHGALTVVHLAERQELKPSETKAAARDRQRLHRERESITSKPKESNKEITPPPPVYTEGEGEGEGEGECHGEKVVTRHGKSVTLEPALAEIMKLHEKNFSIITPILAEKCKSFVENYHGPVEWIALAFAEAVKYKSRRWEYVEAILYSWQEKGGPYADGREPGGERNRPGANQLDTKKDTRFGSFTAIESGPDEPDG